jgi:hypothetical protein
MGAPPLFISIWAIEEGPQVGRFQAEIRSSNVSHYVNGNIRSVVYGLAQAASEAQLLVKPQFFL